MRCVFKVGLIQDLPLDWMVEGKEVKDDLQVFGIGNWSWWPHFLRGEEGRSTMLGANGDVGMPMEKPNGEVKGQLGW